MDWILFFFICSLIILCSCLVTKKLFVKIIQYKLFPLFGETLVVKGGQKTLSLEKFKGDKENCTFDIENMRIEFDIFGLVNPQGTQLFSVCADKFHFSISGFKFGMKKPKRISMRIYIIRQIAKNLFLFIFNSFRFKVHDAEISINGFKLTSDRVYAHYKRQSNVMNFDICLQETVFSFHIPSVRVPHIHITLSASIDCLIRFLQGHIADFSSLVPSLFIRYENARFHVNLVTLSISCKKDPYSEALITLDPIDVYVPLFDLLTTNMTLSVKEIQMSKNLLTTNVISFARMNQNVISIPSLTFTDHTFSLGPLDVSVSSPMFIDIGLLIRYFKTKLDLKPKPDVLADKYALFRTITAKSPEGTLKIYFSDSHVVKFDLNKIAFSDMVVSAKEVNGCIIFGSQIVHFISGHKISARIEPPKLDVKVVQADLVLTDDFPEATFIQEVIGIFKFLQSHIRGCSWETRANLPPTRLIFTLVLKKGTVRYERSKMSVDITRTVEAKRKAMEELRIRQEKALQIIQSKNNNAFDKEAFEHESKVLFVKLYKKALSQLPPPETNILTVEIEGLECGMNGPNIPNRAAALEKIKEICDEVKDEDIGRIGGAPYFGTCEHASWSVPYYGTVLEGDKIESKGTFFTTHHPGKVEKDFYMFRICCDEGHKRFRIPMVSAKSVVFLDINASCKNLSYRWGFAFLEWAQDFKLSSRVFRQRHYKVKWLQFIDHTRFRTRFKVDLKVQRLSVGLNDKINPYGKSYYNFVAPDSHIKFDGRDYKFFTSKLLVCLETKTGFKTIATIYDPKTTVIWNTYNDKMPKDRKRPIFIPIDSSKMTDPNYDPYEEWRTVNWSLTINVVTNNKFAIIDLDHIQDLLDRVTIPRQAIEKFFKPPLFVWRFSPWPKFGFVDVTVRCPPVMITMLQGAFIAKITGDPVNVMYNRSLPQSLNVSSKDINIVCTYKMRNVITANVTDLLVVRNLSVVLVKVANVDANIAFEVLTQSDKIPLHIYRPSVKKELGDLQTVEDLYHHFNNILMTLSIMNINLDFFDKEGNGLGANITRLLIESRFDENKIMLNTFTFTNCDIISTFDLPLVTIKDPQMCIVSATNKKIISCTIAHIDLAVIQSELELLNQLYKSSVSTKKLDIETEPNGNIVKPSFNISFSLETLNANLLKSDRTDLVNMVIKGISVNAKRYDDLSEVIKMSIKKIDAINPSVNDAFRTVIKCNTPNVPIIYLQFNQTKPLMRCPVFDRIDITLSPFIISIDVNYIKNILEFFKSEIIQSFEITEEDIEKIEPDETIENVNAANEDGNVFFCRMFRFNPIDAGLNIRLPREGALSEFLNRPFHFSGMKLEDVFGTKQQIVALLKKKIIWAALKALPKFFFKKNKE